MKRNINLKYFLLLIFIVFTSFSVSTSIGEHDYMDDFIENEKIEELNQLQFYPEHKTEKVSKKLDSLFSGYNKRYDFHGSVIIAKKGKVVFKDHYGFADFRKKTLINNSSIFQLASVSKQFTAAAIMILVEKGELKLEDEVTKYYPDFPYQGVTVSNLLNHTAGLPKYFWLAEHKWKQDHAPSNKEMMDLMARHKVQRFFSPGASFDYSNTGYFVLASIVEKISGTDFGSFAQKEIFEPLGMKDTYVYRFEIDAIKENQLKGYRLYKRRWHAPIEGTVNDAIVGDKNVYSTTEDMMRWVQGLNSGRLLSKKSLEQMYTKGKTKYNKEVPYGFGFRIKENEEDGKIVYHNGKWNGFSTSLMQYPEDDLVVITLEHSKYSSMKTLNAKIKSIVDENFNQFN